MNENQNKRVQKQIRVIDLILLTISFLLLLVGLFVIDGNTKKILISMSVGFLFAFLVTRLIERKFGHKSIRKETEESNFGNY